MSELTLSQLKTAIADCRSKMAKRGRNWDYYCYWSAKEKVMLKEYQAREVSDE